MAKKELTEKAKGVLQDVKIFLENNTDKNGVFAKDVVKEGVSFNSTCASLSALASEEKGYFTKTKKATDEKMLTFFEPTPKFFEFFANNEEN